MRNLELDRCIQLCAPASHCNCFKSCLVKSRIDKHFTIDEVVFAEKGDLLLLGARTLEGLNLAIDPKRKRLVAAGPLLAA